MNENSVIESTLLDASEIHVKKEWYFEDDDGIWNAMVLIREYNKPLRGRSEVLVVDSKNKTVYLAFKPDGSYSIPGGAWEPDENRIQSSVREAQEEARLNVTDVIYSNSYVELDSKPRQWMMEKIRKENWWYGRYSEVYIGEYAGKFTGHINEADKDDMIKIGKFYKIKDVYDELSPYHQKAIDDYMMKKESGLLESSLPLPDNGRPIQVGDISFVYKNTYHPIYWVGDEPYRPRVETLVIKNGKEVFLRTYDTCEEGSLYRYRLPGGSLDNDSTKEQQAENETNEEALLSISEIHNTGLSYYHYYEDGKLLKGGDICIKYKGTISDIFIGKYKGKVDKSTIEKHDLDNDMATNGKFYPIIKVCQLLRPEHIEAIMNSGLVDDNVKGSVRLILRGDKKTKIPEAPVSENLETYLTKPKYIGKNILLYHGSPTKIDRIDPISCNNGTRISGFRMSSFWSDNIGVSIAFSLAQILNGTQVLARFGIDESGNAGLMIVGSDHQTVKNLLQDKVIYLHKKSMPSKMVGRGHARGLQEFTLDIPVVPDEIDTLTYDDYCDYIHYITTAQYEKQKMLSARKNRYVANSKDNIMEKILYYKKDELKKKVKEFKSYTKESNDILHESVIPEGYYDTIVFDFGDVLDKRDKNYMYSYYDKNIDPNDITMDDFKSIIKGYFKFAYNKYGSFKTGKNIDDLYKRTLSEKQRAYYDDALECIENMGSIYDYAIPMLQSLRDKGYKLYYLTNKSKWNWENHGAKEKLKPLMNYFKAGIVSCDVGIEKPDVRIYKLLIKKTGLNPETTLFFDDKAVNTMAAEKVGMTGVVFTEDIVQDIMNLPPVTDTITEMTTSSSIDDNHTKGELMNLSSFKKIKISKSIIDKMKKMIKSLSHIRLDNTEGYIYTDKNNPVAVIVVETKENGQKWIQALEVFGEYKNHGLSKQLLDVAINELSATELSVNKKNDVAYSLYKKYGFKTKSETDTMYMMTLESVSYSVTESLETMINRPFLPKKVTLYHGTDTELDIIRPTSLNSGTILSEPRMSSFWSFDEKISILMALRVILMKYANMDKFITDVEKFKCYICGDLDELKTVETTLNKHPVILYTVNVDRSMIGMGHHPELNEATIDVPIRPQSDKKLYFDDLKPIFELVDDTTYESILNTAIKRKSKKFGRDGHGLFPNILFHSDKKSIEIRKKCKNLTKEPTMESKSYDGALYRVTYDGEGIYNAIKSKVDSNTWKEMLFNDRLSWLPKPPEYTDTNVSYFTKKGFDKFTKTTMPLFSKYIENPKLMGLDKVNGIDNVVYSDDYQVVVSESVDSQYFENKDICHNLESWEPNGNNILFVTGLSGGGKSTISEDVAKSYNAQYVSLDFVAVISMIKYSQEKKQRVLNKLRESCPDAAIYFDDPNNIYTVSSWKNHDENAEMTKRFISWFMNNYSSNGNLYVIEGTQLFRAYDASFFKSYPIIVKGTSFIHTMVRRSTREYKDHIDEGFITAFKKFMNSFKAVFKKGYMYQVSQFNSLKRGMSKLTESESIGANTTGMKRSELPDEMFGIPSQRKYELDTEKHVRSAIKLFNWVDPKYEKELATNIIKRMKYFNITDVNVGPKNRFGKYYKGGNKK